MRRKEIAAGKLLDNGFRFAQLDTAEYVFLAPSWGWSKYSADLAACGGVVLDDKELRT